MIERYTRPVMQKLWSQKAKYDLWLQVELAACRAWSRRGEIPEMNLKTIESKAAYDEARVAVIEEEVRHDVIAFLTSVAEKVGPDSRFIHLGMTSSDLVDTAFALQLKQAGEEITRDLDELLNTLKARAFEHRSTPMIGRTHGIHAEPITFGLKLALWFDEVKRQRTRFQEALSGVSVGKFSGAVGTYVHLSPDMETEICRELGLESSSGSTQVIPRDRHAHFFSVLAGIAATVERIAVEIRHLQRTELFEAAENFGKGQKGSSAMPHKRNPILCENLTGLARLVRGYAVSALENVALWHERDISHSSVERVIGPDATTLVDFMLSRITGVIKNLNVFPERMSKNLESSRGLYASQSLLLALARAGLTREEAYRIVQSAAMSSWNEGKHFYDVIAADPQVKKTLSAGELDEAFDLERYLKHVGTIFERIFGDRSR